MIYDDMQMEFAHDERTTDAAIFIVRQFQDMSRPKDRNVIFAFVNLEKAFERVTRKWLGVLPGKQARSNGWRCTTGLRWQFKQKWPKRLV